MSFGFGKYSGPIAPPSGPTSFGSFSRPPSPTPSPPPFPDSGFSAGPSPRFPSPRTFDAHARTRPPSSIDNGHNARLVTSSSQPYAAPARAPLLHRGDKQIPAAGDFGNQSHKRPFPSTLQDLGTSPSSKFPHFQNPERSRSPPIRYDDDFLQDPGIDIMERNADVSSDYHDRVTTQRRQSPSSTIAASHSTIHPQPSWNNSQRPVTISQTWGVPGRPGGRTTSSQSERSISPTKNVNTWNSKELSPEDDFQRSSYVHRDVSRRPSLSPPKSRIGMSSGQLPDSQYNHQLSPSVDRMNGDAYMTKPASHSVSKRTRSPSSSAGQIIQMNTNPTEDDTDREEQAKAKRLARFKTEHDIVESERGDTIQRGQNVTKGKVPSINADRSVVEKQKSLGDFPSGSMENQDIDNEDLLSSSAIVGLCTDMCPESERGERERKGDLDQYERLDGDRNQTTETLAVKKYNRTAEREAELIRPLPILEKTMDYLLGLLDQPYDDRFLRLYNFMWDRMRAIRMDLRMQHIFNERAITMLEQMSDPLGLLSKEETPGSAWVLCELRMKVVHYDLDRVLDGVKKTLIRLHILAMHELCEFSKGEGFSEGFDAHLNIEQMNKTSVELFQMYDDHRKRGIFIPTEKEFRGYYALLKLDKHPGYKVEPSGLSLDLANMTVEIRQTLDVLFARDVARSCRTANFVAFFRHARKASYLQACLMHAHFSKLRTQALASLHSGLQNNQGIPVAQVAKWLGMEGEDIESLLEYHGFLIKEFEELYMVKEGPFLNDDKDYPTRCSTLVHRKKSDTIVKDVLSSHQVTLLPSEPRKELQSDKQRKNNHAAVKPLQTKSPLVSDDGLMDIEAVSSPIRSIQDQPSLEISRNMISRDSQSFMDPHHMVSAKSPKENFDTFASFQSHSMLNQPSPVTPRHGSFIADAGQLSFKEPPQSFPVQPFVPVANSSNFVWTRQDNFKEPVKSSPKNSPEIVVHSEPKSIQPEVVPANVVKVPTPVSETNSSIVSSIQDNVSMKEMPIKELYDVQQKIDVDIVENYDEEVAEAKLRLLLRLWRRRSVRKKFIREQNRLAANVALSSLSLGPPIRQNQDKPTPCQKLKIDQAMNERYEKSQLSLVRWNVSDLVASKLAEKNENVNCICWKVISFSWLQHGMEARSPVSHLSLDEWLRYKLIPARKEESVENLVISAPGLSVWRKWDSDESGDLRCCLSVIKETQPGAFEKDLVGVNAILFPISETLPWDIQKAQLNNLVTLLPAGACIPLLITSGSGEANFAEFSCSVVDNLGLKDLDKSRISNFMVFCLNEEGQGQFHGFFSDQKLKEGLMWLASESRSQLGLFCVTIRELVSFHLNSCLDALDLMGDEVGPYQCISAFNQALDQSIDNIISAANMNPTGWPCPELSLLDDATAEFKAMKQFLPTLGWSSPEEVEPLISALRNCMLPPFPDDVYRLSRGCSSVKDIEDQNQFLQDCLIRYFTQSVSMLNLMMATKEALLMVQKYARLELHDTEYKVVPNWVLIFRRVFNWYINSSASFSCKAYILEESLSAGSPLYFDKLEREVPKSRYITRPSLDEMVEVSCSPIVSKRIRSPKGLQKVAAIASSENSFGITMPDLVEERNHCSEIHTVQYSDIYPRKNNTPLVLEDEKGADRLSQLLDQCNVLQDDIEKKLSIYF